MASSVGSDRLQRPIQASWLYKHIAALSTGASIKATPGTLHTITINTKGATSNLLTVYDGTSTAGTVIAAVDTTVTYGTLTFDVDFTVGLFYVLAAGTAADITVAYV